MDTKSKAFKIAAIEMLQNDAYSKWLGVEMINIGDGECILRMVVREEMLNGFKIAHGGISYSLSDSALAFASNSLGRKAVSIETSISHVAAIEAGDVLIARAKLKHKSRKIGLFDVEVEKNDKEKVAFFKGMVYFKDEWKV